MTVLLSRSFGYIPRFLNAVADWLAKGATSHICPASWVQCPSKEKCVEMPKQSKKNNNSYNKVPEKWKQEQQLPFQKPNVFHLISLQANLVELFVAGIGIWCLQIKRMGRCVVHNRSENSRNERCKKVELGGFTLKQC